MIQYQIPSPTHIKRAMYMKSPYPLSLESTISRILSFFYLYLFIIYPMVCLHVFLQTEVGTRSYYRWLWATIWLLGIELRTSRRAVNALNHWAISPAPYPGFLTESWWFDKWQKTSFFFWVITKALSTFWKGFSLRWAGHFEHWDFGAIYWPDLEQHGSTDKSCKT